MQTLSQITTTKNFATDFDSICGLCWFCSCSASLFAKQHLEPERMDFEELEKVEMDVVQHGIVAIMYDSIRMHVRIVEQFLKVTSYGYAYQCTLYNCLQCRFFVVND